MGYRFPAEVQTDRIYTERLVMNEPYRMRTPAVNRIEDRKSQPGFKEMLENAVKTGKQQSFKRIYHEVTGTGGRIDRTV